MNSCVDGLSLPLFEIPPKRGDPPDSPRDHHDPHDFVDAWTSGVGLGTNTI